jgi:hypothetical protein
VQIVAPLPEDHGPATAVSTTERSPLNWTIMVGDETMRVTFMALARQVMQVRPRFVGAAAEVERREPVSPVRLLSARSPLVGHPLAPAEVERRWPSVQEKELTTSFPEDDEGDAVDPGTSGSAAVAQADSDILDSGTPLPSVEEGGTTHREQQEWRRADQGTEATWGWWLTGRAGRRPGRLGGQGGMASKRRRW